MRARVGSTGEAVYAGCKAGIIGFSKTLARELARYSINVNVVCPGPTQTALLKTAMAGREGVLDAMARGIPFRRLGQPEDLAGAVAFFASSDADYATGQVHQHQRRSDDGGMKPSFGDHGHRRRRR